ncbi:MAG: flavodoxin family protein [Desulfurivibrionaceae bacterium]|nr:flavodoxin family protein [Desulfurivibrionaceae bacterium]
MRIKILGISGSPIENSNTDRALQIALEATGYQTEFIKLSDYTVGPCNGCLGCTKTNRCVIKDDGIMLTEKAYKANALIIAGWTPYASIDSRTKAFMERLYALRHRHGLMHGKPGAAIVTSTIPEGLEGMALAGDLGIGAIENHMRAEGMHFVGGVKVAGNVPCIHCGDDRQCAHSSLKSIYGRDATIAQVGINRPADSPATMAALEKLGKDIGAAVYG